MKGCFGWCLHQRNKYNEQEEVEIPAAAGSNGAEALAAVKDTGMIFFGNPEKKFDLEELLGASAEVLGKGNFGATYKVSSLTGPLVVKRLMNVDDWDSQFIEMFDTIGHTNHENLLPVKAYSCNDDEKFIVYDYMPMGSLSALLQRNRGANPLNWDTRLGIVVGVARSIAHLHSLGPAIVHGNIKPSNILLTASFEARVSDYLPYNVVEPRVTFAFQHVGYESGVGYRALEVTRDRKVSQKADVYSFGVVLLELLTGKKPIFQDEFTSEKVYLRRWILSAVEDELLAF